MGKGLERKSTVGLVWWKKHRVVNVLFVQFVVAQVWLGGSRVTTCPWSQALGSGCVMWMRTAWVSESEQVPRYRDSHAMVDRQSWSRDASNTRHYQLASTPD
jgi:hypothetical protein